MSEQMITAEPSALNFWQSLKMSSLGLTDNEFMRLCQDNEDLRLELTAEGELVIMPPTGGDSGWRNLMITHRFTDWIIRDGTGLGFDSSTMFVLPNGARRGPDLSWVRRERWDVLTRAQQRGFPPLCPDFVMELRSPTDGLADLEAKMEEYRANGARLGWLIDPLRRRVHVYRPDQPVQILTRPDAVTDDEVLPGLSLRLSDLW